MKLIQGDKFCRDDFNITITNITKSNIWRTSVDIFVNEKKIMSHAFKSEMEPNRECMTLYINEWVPNMLKLISK